MCGDSGYTGADKRAELQAVKAGFLIAEKPSKLRAMKNARDHGHAVRGERYKASLDERAMPATNSRELPTGVCAGVLGVVLGDELLAGSGGDRAG